MTIFRVIMSFLLLLLPQIASAQFDDFLKGIDKLSLPGAKTLGDDKIISGLKEALTVGTENTVKLTGNPDGFLKNEAIRILLPEELQSMDKALRLAGFGPQVDELVVSMNRAAEQAAPLAKPIFKDAVANMSFDDAKKILNGKDTAATDYFQGKTRDQLAIAFKPEVEKTMSQVGVTKQYKDLVGQYTTLPFVTVPAFNLDDYVVGKSLDGLFLILGEEEKKIRTNPTARVTDLLKDVFGK
ncbi:MAG TPA: DUF4197 domain-containing protein [Nitrospirales bacterium]|nr:DUF4197 domain-containing protein [Nitrospira sp. MA-1]HNP60419.1 DUF4197 domain-containing protein [Nitrospirales bacterium]